MRLNFVSDRDAIDDIIQDRNPDSPPSGTVASLALNWAVRRQKQDVNHLVMATDSQTGRHAGFLVAHDRTTGAEPFLLLEATLACAPADRVVVLRRMVGMAILRMIGTGMPLSVIAVRTRTPALCNVLLDLSRRVAGSALHPEPWGNLVCLETAALAHRVAWAAGEKPRFSATARAMVQAGAGRRGRAEAGFALSEETTTPVLAVLDLRAVPEAALIEGARWLYRTRLARNPASARPGVPATTGLPCLARPYAATFRYPDVTPADLRRAEDGAAGD
jgi:hypothetical protein